MNVARRHLRAARKKSLLKSEFFSVGTLHIKQMTHLLKSDKSELIVFGYLRKKYAHSIPVALLSLIQSFYTLWKKRRLTESEFNELYQLQEDKSITIEMHTIRINRIPLTFYIKMWVVQYSNGHDELFFELCVDYPESVDFIAGYFHADFRSEESYEVWWRRTKSRRRQCRLNPGEQYDSRQKCSYVQGVPMAGMSVLKTLSFDCYYGFHQIAFSPKAQIPDLDITPLFVNGKTLAWEIDCSQYDKEFNELCHEVDLEDNSQWDLAFEYDGNAGSGRLDVTVNWLPFKVHSFYVAVSLTLKYDEFELDVTGGHHDYVLCSKDYNFSGHQSIEFYLSKDIVVNHSKIYAEATLKIERVHDVDGNEIDLSKEQSEKFGIISSQ